ncbi:hypothetical protein Dform_01769 [Dehalogenimonas formicexedens]|uniref:Uncharacterized protein n=1 Tax=Dehalogenimonas formicexedens TaxID=1839801 RepID=A0A1P8F9G2_9CHLR|nr:hypothetical protein [Dehalogenimonas formicexedens]APV45088.1 hypothetical protein Dform_01769 [Dehalogenimonas formicexedens]
MPKKYSVEDRAEWLILSEKGESEAKIGNDKEIDLRTVKAGIIQARRERERREANVSLIRDALKRHQEQLLTELSALARSLEPSAVEAEAISWYKREPISVYIDREQAETLFISELFPKTSAEKQTPLKQHLGRSKLARELSKWQKSNISHLLARIGLQYKTIALIKEKTGLPVVSENNEFNDPFIFSYTACRALYKYALRWRIEKDHEESRKKFDVELESGMVINSETHWVSLFKTVLAEVKGGDKVKCRADLLAAYEELKKAPELEAVAMTLKKLETIGMTLKELITEYIAPGLLPGSCSVCERIGI